MRNPLHFSCSSSAHWFPCARAGAVALATLAALAAEPRVACADDERIGALIAAGRSLEALPLALDEARTRGGGAAWRRAHLIAGWNSRDDAAVESLRALVALEPGQRAWRLDLARRLLWRSGYAEAEAHARWLAARADERDPVALEVATLLLAGADDRSTALAVARRWEAAAPADPRARWALADLTHWSARWREARDAYRALEALPTESARARERLGRLRREHPDDLAVEATGWCDTTGVQYVAATATATAQLPARLVFRVRAEGGRWSRGDACGPVVPQRGPPPTDGLPTTLGVGSVQGSLRVEAWDAVQPEVQLGLEGDGAEHVAGFGSVGVRLALAGRVFGRVWVQYDRYRASLASAARDVRALGPALSLYAEPSRWIFASTEALAWWLDDDNLRVRALLAVGAHNPGAWQVEPRAFATVEWFRAQRPAVVPYFTPTEAWTFGGDLTLRHAPSPRLRLEATLGVAVQGGEVALRPAVLARFDLGAHVRVSAAGGYVGSPQYQQLRADLGVSWIF